MFQMGILASVMASEPAPLPDEMRRLDVRSARLVASQEIDESPVWSPVGDAIAVNITGEWRKVELRGLKLKAGTWHGKEPIGVIESPALVRINASTVETWERAGRAGPREVMTGTGTKVELLSEDLGTRFVITAKGSPPETLWRTGLENCHSLALSANEAQVAFLCELNGLIVTNLAK
jgi:hypothetical protein